MQKILGKVIEKIAAAFRAALWPLFQRRGYSEFARSHGGQRKVTLFAKVIVRPRTAGQFSLFEAAVQEVAEVVSAHRLAGSDDYLLELKQDYPVQLDQLKAEVLAPLPGFVDCSIAVVARTAVDPDVFSESVGSSDARPRWSANPRAALPV